MFMFDRVYFKQRAKENLSGRWIIAIILAFFLSFTSVDAYYNWKFDGNSSLINNETTINNEIRGNEYINISDGKQTTMRFNPQIQRNNGSVTYSINLGGISDILLLGLPILILATLLGLALNFFLLNPLRVGLLRWFTDLDRGVSGRNLEVILMAFKEGNYLNVVKVMALKDIKLVLWTLLLIIPGIIKSYEYFGVDYILGIDPGMESKEVFEKSKQMTDGNKMSIFILELSFIGWFLLILILIGILTAIFGVIGIAIATIVSYILYSILDAYVAETMAVAFNSLYDDNFIPKDNLFGKEYNNYNVEPNYQDVTPNF